jgi:hypothetical protein
VLFKVDDPTPFDIQAEVTLKTNFFATRNVCTELLPIMKPHGKSKVGLLSLGKWPSVPQIGQPTGTTQGCHLLVRWRVKTALFYQGVWLCT